MPVLTVTDSSPLASAIGSVSMTVGDPAADGHGVALALDAVAEDDELVPAEAGDQCRGGAATVPRCGSAIWQSSSSPTSWPWVSLTSLKRSRSRKSRAT